MVILADKDRRELGEVLKANISVNPNGKEKEKRFSLQIARKYWNSNLTFSNYVYVPGTEYGGIIGEVITDTSLDYVDLKGYTWRGRMRMKVIEPPAGVGHKVVSGELNTVLRELIEPEFDGLFIVPQIDTEKSIKNYQFDRYCTLLDGCVKMLKSVGYRLHIEYRKDTQEEPGHVYVKAVPIEDYSEQIELSEDSRLHYTMDMKKDGVNHLIVAGKGEMQDRNVFHLYAWPDGSIKSEPYYTGIDEIVELYDNTSAETGELESKSEEKLREIMSKNTFHMDVERLGIDVGIGDIVGARDYLTGMHMSKPVENILYESIRGVVSKTYKLEGEDA